MSKSLEHAPAHIKLAVDLIMLLEQHQLDANTVLQALHLVQQDFIKKQALQQNQVLGGNPTSHIPAHTS